MIRVRCNDGEHRLEDHEGLMGNRRRIIGTRCLSTKFARPFQAPMIPILQPPECGNNRKNPLEADDADDNETLH